MREERPIDPNPTETLSVGYPGRDGAHSAAACERLFPTAELKPLPSFAAVAEAISERSIEFGVLPIDSRFTIWPIAAFVLAIGRITVRQELLNARIAVRRAVLYTGAVAVLTVIALLLIAVRPYAVAVLLFPLLYLWPRFDARLNRRLYPQRARFPELLRTLGTEMAECESVDAVLDVLTRNRENIALAIARLGPYATELGEAVTSGPFFNSYIQNLLPTELIEPALTDALERAGAGGGTP